MTSISSSVPVAGSSARWQINPADLVKPPSASANASAPRLNTPLLRAIQTGGVASTLYSTLMGPGESTLRQPSLFEQIPRRQESVFAERARPAGTLAASGTASLRGTQPLEAMQTPGAGPTPVSTQSGTAATAAGTGPGPVSPESRQRAVQAFQWEMRAQKDMAVLQGQQGTWTREWFA